VLVGRAAERAAIEAVLEGARSGRGAALVIAGEPGIGKSSLLAAAESAATDMRVLRAAGVEAESRIAHAGLHQLLGPALDNVDCLAESQARALRVVLEVEAGEAPSPFLVAMAALSLLSDLANELPVVCLVDDAHWMDAASMWALGFVCRRLTTEHVAMILAARDGGGPPIAGLPALTLGRLDDACAREVIAERWDVAPAVLDRLVEACAGNPLALRELPGTLTANQLLGRAPLPPVPPLPRELETVFRKRTEQLPASERAVLLIAAAEGSGHVRTIRTAALHLGLDADLLEAVPDLVGVEGTRIMFRHPLIRSAVYHGAGLAERRSVHRALAESMTDEEDADRRAWHLAEAAEGRDGAAAKALEESAERTVRRAGHAVAAAALERAADLSEGEMDQARLLTRAAEAAWTSGSPRWACALLDREERLSSAARDAHTDAIHLRALIALRDGVPGDGLALLMPALRRSVDTSPERAARMLLTAIEAAFHAHSERATREVAELAERVADRTGDDAAALARLVASVSSPAAPTDLSVLCGHLAGVESLDLVLRVSGMALSLGDDAECRRLRMEAMTRARVMGAAGTLAWALQSTALDELRRGRFRAAEAAAKEGLELARETGQGNVACHHLAALVEVAATRGREEEAGRLAASAQVRATTHGLPGAAAVIRRALARMALARGQADTALDLLDGLHPLWLPEHRGLALFTLVDLAEAVARTGAGGECREWVERDLALAATIASDEARASVACARALLSSGGEAEAGFLEALRLQDAVVRPMDRARTTLLYGEFLRRGRRRVEARPHLRRAIETFEALGVPVWAERARTELRATGEAVRRAPAGGMDELTTHEERIVNGVQEGLTNREIAARLFISPRTVDHHLRSVFRKLGIGSRAELIRMPPDGHRDWRRQPS
jgi:DNA-binding CsgD family transcriptional regulator